MSRYEQSVVYLHCAACSGPDCRNCADGVGAQYHANSVIGLTLAHRRVGKMAQSLGMVHSIYVRATVCRVQGLVAVNVPLIGDRWRGVFAWDGCSAARSIEVRANPHVLGANEADGVITVVHDVLSRDQRFGTTHKANGAQSHFATVPG